MTTTLQELAQINIFGAPFLFTYGVTWTICALLWIKVQPAYAAIATLFQGMVSQPLALGILYLIDAFQYRPEVGEINDLSVLLAMSQLLILPLLIAMFRRKHYTLIPFVFSGAGAVHFLIYAWLYQTPVYIVLSLMIAFVIAIIYGADAESESVSTAAAARTSLFTGLLLILAASYFLILN